MYNIIIYISLFIFSIDQLTKIIVSNINNVESISVLNNFLNITYHQNNGAAFGILSAKTELFIIVSIIALIFIIKNILLFKNNSRNILAFSLLLGGITGNLFDRIIYGFVRDFIDFRINNYHFPIFNIADMAVVIGSILIIYAILKGEDNNDNNRSRKQ